ncbi:TPA: hypothetical protein DDW35_02610 [Candidatus Sumerlaeota bacterium]|jgi:8-oxo-dGTP diphosphatase|nr:hypothetical protein [Candidatus Sumerlaeota bacterium]
MFTDVQIIPPTPGEKGAAFMVQADGQIYHAYRYRMPAVSVTMVVREKQHGMVLLAKRGNDPYKGWWSLPGGFVEAEEETTELAAARELLEETGIRVSPDQFRLVDVRSKLDRDVRYHVIDVGYYVEVDGAEAVAGDDVCEIRWANASEVEPAALAFDHGILFKNAKCFFTNGTEPLDSK